MWKCASDRQAKLIFTKSHEPIMPDGEKERDNFYGKSDLFSIFCLKDEENLWNENDKCKILNIRFWSSRGWILELVFYFILGAITLSTIKVRKKLSSKLFC